MRDVRSTLYAAFLTAASLTVAPGAPAQEMQIASDLMSVPQIFFAFDRPGLPVPQYELTIRRDGSVVYAGEEQPPATGPGPASGRPSQSFQRVVSISAATVNRVFVLAQKLNHFNIPCASNAKNIADTGKKTLTYAGSDGAGSCTYNYTENKDVQALTDIFEGIAETMDEGRRLDYLHRYDRLGLDAAMESFSREVAEGRALEMGTIAPTLRSIADDPEVMQRVRTRANALLTLVPAQARQSAQ